MDFLQLRLTCGLTTNKTADLFGRSKQTIKKWDKGIAPIYAKKFLKFLSKDLSFHNKAWQGFYFDGNVLITPSKKVVSPGDILSLPYLVQSVQLSRFYDSVT